MGAEGGLVGVLRTLWRLDHSHESDLKVRGMATPHPTSPEEN